MVSMYHVLKCRAAGKFPTLVSPHTSAIFVAMLFEKGRDKVQGGGFAGCEEDPDVLGSLINN